MSSSLTPLVDSLFQTTDPVEVKIRFQVASGDWKRAPATMKRLTTETGEKLFKFLASDQLLKNAIKSMAGSKWHPEPDFYWSIVDSPRNRFQLEFLLGGNPYAWFDRPLVKHDYPARFNLDKQQWLKPFAHQAEDADLSITYHFQIDASEMGVGKSLARILHMEKSGIKRWWWVTRASLIGNAKREFHDWQLDKSISVEVISYDEFVSRVNEVNDSEYELVQGIIFDEASAIKNPVAKRSIAAQKYTDDMRAKWGHECHVVLMSGTPSPKNPAEWWNLCEIVYPGYLREGTRKALEQRLGIFTDQEFASGMFRQRVAWKDDDDKCSTCGLTPAEHTPTSDHIYRPIKNEVAYLKTRLQSLAFVRLKKDVLKDLPEKTYRTIFVKPSPSILRAAKLMVETADSAMTALQNLRELSDGFQYKHTPEGRVTEQIICPKDQVLVDLLAENDDVGRMLVFGGFEGTLDRIKKVSNTNGWAVIRCDGYGIHPYDESGQPITGVDWYADVWRDRQSFSRVVWDANPESGGLGFTLVEAYMAFFYSNSFKTEYRTQSEDRHHRPGMDTNKGGIIVDVVHLPCDERIIKDLREDRRLEKMTLGEINDSFALAA